MSNWFSIQYSSIKVAMHPVAITPAFKIVIYSEEFAILSELPDSVGSRL